MDINSSPFALRIGTNYVLADDEVVQMESVLSEPTKSLQKLDMDISKVQVTLDALLRQRRQIQHFIDEHRALSTPVRRLPPDILGEVFMQCLPSHQEAIMSYDTAPLLLTHICSGWRSLAITTPQLWSSIHIVAAPSTPISSEEIAKEWFRRSGGCPLSITLVVEAEPDLSDHRQSFYCGQLIDVVLSVSKRWKKLSISARMFHLSKLYNISPNAAPMLETLIITKTSVDEWGSNGLHGSDQRHPDPPFNESDLIRLPTLKRLSLSGLRVNLAPFPIAWATLTDLTVHDEQNWADDDIIFPSPKDARKILLLCTQLITLNLNIRPHRPASPLFGVSAPFPTITHPFLRQLGLYATDTGSKIPTFTENLDLPALIELRYSATGTSRARADHSLLQVLQSIGHTLEVLQTEATMILDRQTFIDCLYCCPRLRSLSIVTDLRTAVGFGQTPRWISDHITLDDDFLAILWEQDGLTNRYLCPNLEELKLDCLKLEISDKCVRNILEKRGDPDPSLAVKLKSLSITFERTQRESLKDAVDTYENGGGKVQLFYQSVEKQRIKELVWAGVSRSQEDLPNSIF